MARLTFDPRRPLFVSSQPLQAFGKVWAVESHFPWEDMGMDYQDNTIHQMYASNLVQHRPDLEGMFIQTAEKAVGDGLETMPLAALHMLVDKINKDIKPKCKNAKEFHQRRVPHSKIQWRQVDLIRRWRKTYGHMEI